MRGVSSAKDLYVVIDSSKCLSFYQNACMDDMAIKKSVKVSISLL